MRRSLLRSTSWPAVIPCPPANLRPPAPFVVLEFRNSNFEMLTHGDCTDSREAPYACNIAARGGGMSASARSCRARPPKRMLWPPAHW
jgi:hypothetical protein